MLKKSGPTLPFASIFSWDETYATELQNFNDHGDEGEIWFGEDSLFRVLRWFDKNEDKVPKTAKILDLGCGNGVTCVHLAQEGFNHVAGVDYSPDAIALSRKLAEKHDAQGLTFEVGPQFNPLKSCFDLN